VDGYGNGASVENGAGSVFISDGAGPEPLLLVSLHFTLDLIMVTMATLAADLADSADALSS
jgi:hypothetical protein